MLKPGQLIEHLVAVTAVVLLVGACLVILSPFFAPLLWGAIISFCSWHIYVRLVKALRGRRNLAAALMVFSIFLFVAGPFLYAGRQLAEHAGDIKTFADQLIKSGVPALPDWITALPVVGEPLQTLWNNVMNGDANIADFVRGKFAAPAGQWLLKLGAAAGNGLVQLLLSILLAFFFYVGGNVAFAWLRGVIARIADERGPHLLQLAGNTIKGVVYGILGTASVQAILAGIGFAMAGVPGAAIWGLATFFASIVPMGPVLVWLPAALWLYATGSVGWAIFTVLWGALVIGSVDNIIKPMLISKGGGTPFIVVLLGVLGGALAFGFLGVFIGPTLLSVGYSVLHDWALGVQPGPAPGETPGAKEQASEVGDAPGTSAA